jgi:hypothetical protein
VTGEKEGTPVSTLEYDQLLARVEVLQEKIRSALVDDQQAKEGAEPGQGPTHLYKIIMTEKIGIRGSAGPQALLCSPRIDILRGTALVSVDEGVIKSIMILRLHL